MDPTRAALDELTTSARAGDPIALARILVSTPSVNPELEAGGTGESEVARRAAEWLDAWGFRVETGEVTPGRWNVVARREGGEEGPRLLLNGHLDTVGVAGMEIPPFQAGVRDGRLWGRGAADMKGGVAALLSAARRLAEEGHPGALIVALTADEEHASTGMQALVRSGIGADGAVVCEPTSLAVMPAHKGFLWLRLRFRGRAAHGSRPDEGVDAIRHAAQYLAGLDGYETRLSMQSPHPLLGVPSVHAGTISGGSAPSVYPERCELVLERRTLPGEAEEEVVAGLRRVLEGVRAVFPDVDVSFEPGLFRPGTEVPRGSALVAGLLAAVEAVGLESRVEGMTAWVDAAFLNEAGIPAVCFGPGSIARAHTADESCKVGEIRAAAAVLERFGAAFLAGR